MIWNPAEMTPDQAQTGASTSLHIMASPLIMVENGKPLSNPRHAVKLPFNNGRKSVFLCAWHRLGSYCHTAWRQQGMGPTWKYIPGTKLFHFTQDSTVASTSHSIISTSLDTSTTLLFKRNPNVWDRYLKCPTRSTHRTHQQNQRWTVSRLKLINQVSQHNRHPGNNRFYHHLF